MARYKDGKYTRLGSIYHNMKTRCYNPNYDKYQYYGGKGIKICDEWLNSYDAFEEWAESHGYRKDLTLDRIDVNGDYTPDNCRWIGLVAQANNRTTNRIIKYGGKQLTIAEWARELNIPDTTLRQRISEGWSIKRAFTEPYHNTHCERILTMNGVSKRMYEWAKEYGISYKVLQNRIDLHGWPVEKAITTPVRKRA